jgi:hypothetical protein
VSVLNVLLTHLAASAVGANVDYLGRVAPEARFAVAHGGRAADFEAVAHPEKVFVDDPTLRAAPRSMQSYHVTLEAVHERFVRADPAVEAVYVFEWDHVILRAGFEQLLGDLAARTGAGFMGKTCVERTGTNWHHYTRFRRDEALLAHLRRLSVRDDPTRLFGTLGNGFWISREALADYVAVTDRPQAYGELYVPTLLHHLGHRLVDIDGHGDLYRYVRYEPELALTDVLRAKRAGAAFAHPFKESGAFAELLAAPGLP